MSCLLLEGELVGGDFVEESNDYIKYLKKSGLELNYFDLRVPDHYFSNTPKKYFK